MKCDLDRKHFEFENEFVSMKKSFPGLYYDCGCCKDCVRVDGHRQSCPLNTKEKGCQS